MDREKTPNRLLSLDLLRGLVVLLMFFVNQADGLEGVPAFLRHAPEDADAITLADLVLPGFLLMVGMSIPLSLGARLRRGEVGSAWRHALTRGLALLAIGVLTVNVEQASPAALLAPSVWGLILIVAVILAWQAPPPAGSPPWRRWPRATGIALLVLLVLVYRGTGVSGLVQIRPYWWGVLGVIGWAYLVAAAVYLVVGERLVLLACGVLALDGLYFVDQLLDPGWVRALRPFVGVGGLLGTHGAVTLSGVLLSVAAVRGLGRRTSPWSLAARAAITSLAFVVAGLLLHLAHGLHPAFRFSKESATPAWGLAGAGIAGLVWAALYAAADAGGFRRWPPVLRMAGENALLAYLLEPLLVFLLAVLAYPLGRHPWEYLQGGLLVGLLRAALFAWIIGRLAGLLARLGVRLRL